jgi:hypothetical protein
MTNGWPPDLNGLEIEGALTLLVVSRSRSGLEPYAVDLREDAEAAFREACHTTLTELQAAQVVVFGPDVYLESGEYLAVPDHVVGLDHPILDLLHNAGAAEALAPTDIPRLWFYAVLVGDNPDDRLAFIRKADPHIVAKTGRAIMTLGDALRVINRPVFVIDERFDLLVLPGGLAVAYMTPFEVLFRGTDEMEARVDVWATAISDNIQIAPEDLELLVESARRNSRLGRKMRSIYERGHLANVQIATIRDAAAAMGLDVAAIFEGDRLLIREDSDLTMLLRLLNEDLFEGALTGQDFAADRKRLLQ